MAKFIIVHEKGQERMVNLAWVEEIRPDDGRAIVYLAFQGNDCLEPDYIRTDESYEAVKEKIWRKCDV